ncbi:scaffold protein Nfu/NifU N terminal-domain-containing protein [Triangularia verruculosa]|uniref:Scaffold protein Nfu/NifU N terminal-domain-containing protein n=1 Tax=Triangularia verruculosa TaxID=2587418 RepID=A0AAN6XNP7_9PEZI|nr:scaffold protein Nfu/NifU N terminal-domain-containing protein [Triangularia verruculosa]
MPSTKLLRGLAPLVAQPFTGAAARRSAQATATSLLRLRQPPSQPTPSVPHRAAHTSTSGLRPKLPSQQWRPTTTTTQTKRTIFIQTEPTPNPNSLKFLPNHPVLPPTLTTPFIEYLSPRSTISPPYPSPLASNLMNIDGVTSVFYGQDFITVTKSADAVWAHIRPEIFSLITEAITSGQPLVTLSTQSATAESGNEQESGERDSLEYDENDSEVVGMIKELLETRIRPAIQEDGGDIEFRGFENGIVMLKLRGACRTCDSSTVTLKNGIEGMLMHYIEEVQGVEQVLDEEEEIAIKEFAKFEEKLRAQKGSVPESTGKGGLDSVPG